ncbi:MAG TPA: ATP-binding protein [Longimicrobiales bacterium]|nr:ATP-binding protein [Longimicrobiales bacterium]
MLQQTISSLDNIAESRGRLLHAYLIYDRQVAGDATFEQSSAMAEIRAAEYALGNWMAGRSGIIAFPAAAPAEESLLAPLRRYQAALVDFRETVANDADDMVSVRQHFSYAEQAAEALEGAIHTAVRDSVIAEARAYRLRLAGWGFLLVTSVFGASYARRALRASEMRTADTESRLSRLRELAPVGIAECNANGEVVAANPMWRSFTNQDEDAGIGQPWWNAIAEDDRQRACLLWQQTPPDSGLTMEARLAAPDADGNVRWVLIRPGAREAKPSTGRRRVVTFTDITHQRNVEEQLHHAQRMEAVGRLAGGVAHDFNNLLTSIGGFASLAREGVTNNPALVADLLEIEGGVNRGRALTRQLLTFSRQDRIDPRVINASQVVRGMKRMLGVLAGTDVDIETFPLTESATVLVDPNQLEQVITNLVINAADAMEGRGRIRIGIETVRVEESFPGARSDITPGDYVVLTVSDTGPGVPPGVRERMFEPFFTTKERGKGTGLGLSTVWGIVRQGGGHIHVYSVAGQGTVFKIYFPAEAGAGPSEHAAAERLALRLPRGAVVLVVDDEDAVRRLTCRVLQLNGCSVLEAAGGMEALRIIESCQRPLDMVITDLMMRGMGGVELVERLRAQGMEAPVLFISGYADSQLALGDVPFLEKPFTPAALLLKAGETLVGANRQ